ncbi:MAG: TonB-dependent receptor [Pseudomonadota bacterium]
MNYHRIALSAALLASTGLVPVSAAWAQEGDTASTQTDDIIVVRYQFVPDDKRVTSEVSSFLNVDDIITTGDSDIASALGRVTGLSVADGRFVIVRGLNERYSNTLINGSPLASPEPLRRAVPLDLFPTGLISNILVQKTYSPRFPGEFGGGLVEIETSALPNEGFLGLSFSSAANTETTFNEGIVHRGGSYDWTGFSDSTRDWPSEFVDILESENIGPAFQDPTVLANIGRNLANSPLTVLQIENEVEPDFGFGASLGERFEFDGFSLGVLAAVGFDNSWDTRRGVRRTTRTVGAAGSQTIEVRNDSERFTTSNTVESNGMFNVGLEFDQHEIQALALVLRSTDKRTTSIDGFNADRDQRTREDTTGWFERQVYTYQLAGDHTFEIGDGLNLEWRASTSDASRNAPNQREAVYLFEEGAGFRNLPGLDGNGITFSRVDDVTDEYGFDVSLPVNLFGLDWEWSAGYSDMSKERTASARNFGFVVTGSAPSDLFFQRIDFIYADPNILSTRFSLQESGGVLTPEAYRGQLDVEGAYIATDVELTPFLRAAFGGRWESGQQVVDTFSLPQLDPSDVGDREGFIDEDYFLPAVTLTWTFADNMQARFGYSQTITRPQFRELGPTTFFNTETDERFRGNPFLVNTEITNLDARFEWYFGRDQFFTIGAFYKDLDKPIVEYLEPEGESLATSFINAPAASLLGFEVEFERTFDFADRFSDSDFLGDFWDNAEFFIKANYTYTQSEMEAGDGDVVLRPVFSGGTISDTPASDAASGFIRDGEPLQGQSEHLANIQIGWEDTNSGARTALLFNYTGERTRALQNLAVPVPEVVEEIPMMVDLVHSRSFELADGGAYDLRFAIRNLFDERYEAYQESGGQQVIVDDYDIGTTFSISLSRSF